MHYRLTISALALSALALGACTTTTGPFDGDPNERAKTGALIGGLVGAAAGAGESRDRALIGAALGAAVGAAIGNELDKQARALEASIDNDQVTIVNTGSQLIVTMPQDILFAVDSTFVNDSLRADLAAVAQNLNEFPNSTVQVIGHTDNTGTAAYNLDLSQRRARSVGNILVANGVASNRVQTVGRGEDQPVASNLDEFGRAQNRRVEIVIIPTA